MKATTEMELKVSGGRILSAEVKDGICRLLIEVVEEKVEPTPAVKETECVSVAKEDDDLFVCIKASELSLIDEFMQHRPKSEKERILKGRLKDVILKRIDDFWRPRMDPTLDEAENICFKAGKEPAVGRSYNWWHENAKKYCPKRKSRLGTKSQYVAFLGVLIKTLVDEGWTVDEAWDAVCNDSKKLGHYRNSENARYDFEPTGSSAIAGFYDLVNTCKILAEDEETGGFWLVGGCYFNFSSNHPLADLGHYIDGCNYDLNNGVGWLVLS
ncbi:MAG: hypothetical protein J6M02_06495 [Clostridia bacterium]|nr:hypothetical protein [Clostridia bacterium]